MKILGIDFGTKKIGLATAVTALAEVYGVIRFRTTDDAIKKIKKVVDDEKIEKIVIGISEGEMAKQTKEFSEKLKETVSLPLEFQDETLSTKDAQRMAIDAGVKRKKRREYEDAFAAALILQQYLDENG